MNNLMNTLMKTALRKLSRHFKCRITLALSCLLVSGLSMAEPVTLETQQGKLLGETQGKDNSISVFKGIPYALPPVGVRRWKPAEPAPGWRAVRVATEFGPGCAQLPYPEGSFFSRPNAPTSEDCLYLNVWTSTKTDHAKNGAVKKEEKDKEKQPVMVWIHGGALTRGSGSTPTYDGTHLAEKGVVVVTINYRLDIFGHFAHPQLSAESPNKVSGNYATTDQLQALQWVQQNIAAFGGDPDNVTIFGESAGSWSVHQLVATPLAKGLFQKAIGESGAVLDVMSDLKESVGGVDSAEASGEKLAKAAGMNSIDDLRALTADELLQLSTKYRFRSRAVVDGWLFPDQIYNIMAAGKQNPVPVIVGFNSDEGTTLGALSRVPKDKRAYEQFVKTRYGDMADEYLKLYSADDLEKSTLDSFRDGFVTWPMQSWAMMTAKVKQPAYLYYFTHHPAGPNKDELGAYHAAEIRYVFDNYQEDVKADQEIGGAMSDYWVSFAKNGDPNLKGRPEWKPYLANERNYIEFNCKPNGCATPAKDVLPGVWEFYERYNAKSRP